MKEVDFLDAVGRVDQKFVDECITYVPPKKMNVWVKRVSAIAACFAVVIASVLIVNHINQPKIIDENGFYIENGVLLRYTGTETDVTIPDAVEEIADFAFLENENVKKIEVVRLGASVQKVEPNAFAGLENLINLIISENNLSFIYENGLIMTSDGSILLRYEREGETTFTIPDSVRYIAAHAVQGTKLEEIDFGENLEYIGYNAFASNYVLKAIYLPDTVKYISEGAFSGCSSAVDGHIPEGAEIGQWAFEGVPFYISMLAGQMCPGEEIVRGLITPSEAVLQSDQYSLSKQLEYLYAAMRGDDYMPDETAIFGSGAVGSFPSVPEGLIVPNEVDLSALSFTDSGWGTTGIYDVNIHISAGEYTVVVQAYAYGAHNALYWSNVRFRLEEVYYMPVKTDDLHEQESVSAFGWTAVFERDGLYYEDVTFVHEDGRIVHNNLGYLSSVQPSITFSPDGTRAAVEYRHQNGFYSFYVVTLNGDILREPNYPYAEYLDGYYGQYVEKTLTWVDNDTIEGENEYGRFRFNIYGYQAEIIEPKDDEDWMLEGYVHVTVPPSLSADVGGLPFPEDSAKMKFTLVGGSPEIYVPGGKELRFYVVYKGLTPTYYESVFNLPNGYENGEIIYASGGAGSGEYFMFVSAELQGKRVLLAYYFYADGSLPQPEEVIIMEGEWKTYIEELAYGLPDGSDPAALTGILSMTVSDIEKLYGKLTLEYSEHGTGQPVYSMAHLSGMNLVFHGHFMNEPLKADMKSAEIIISGDYGRKIHGLAVRDYVESTDISWESAEYSVINGTVTLTANFDTYRISCAVATRWENIPDDTAPQSEWDAWEAKFLSDPRGEIRQIRISLNS